MFFDKEKIHIYITTNYNFASYSLLCKVDKNFFFHFPKLNEKIVICDVKNKKKFKGTVSMIETVCVFKWFIKTNIINIYLNGNCD